MKVPSCLGEPAGAGLVRLQRDGEDGAGDQVHQTAGVAPRLDDARRPPTVVSQREDIGPGVPDLRQPRAGLYGELSDLKAAP